MYLSKFLSNTNTWRLAFVASGAAMLIGGPKHPEADAKHDLRHELAEMTAHDDWVFSHSLIMVSAALLATGLWLAHRSRSWPVTTRRALFVTSIIVSVYVVETVFHLTSAVDTESLRNGDVAPVAFTHVALSILLYPVSGLAIAYLAAKLFATTSLARKPFAAAGIVGGVMHALSVPLTLVFPDTEFTPLFAGSAMLVALWSLGTGLAGLGDPARRAVRVTALATTPARSAA